MNFINGKLREFRTETPKGVLPSDEIENLLADIRAQSTSIVGIGDGASSNSEESDCEDVLALQPVTIERSVLDELLKTAKNELNLNSEEEVDKVDENLDEKIDEQITDEPITDEQITDENITDKPPSPL